MKRNIFILFLFAWLFISMNAVKAQTTAGFIAGLNIASYGGDGANELSSKTGLHAGILVDIDMKNDLYLEPSILYTNKGTSYKTFQFNVKYIEVPLTLKYKSRGSLGLVLGAGPYVAFFPSATVENAAGQEGDITGLFRTSDAGATFYAGFESEMGLGVLLRYEKGFSNIWADATLTQIGQTASNNNEVFCISVIYTTGKKKKYTLIN